MGLSSSMSGMGYMRAAPKAASGGKAALAGAAKNQLIAAQTGTGGFAGVPTGSGGGGSGGGGGTPSSGGSSTQRSLLDMLRSHYETTYANRQERYGQGLGILEGVAGQFGPDYLKGEERSMVADMEQSMVGRGLSSTTRPGAASVGIKADIRDRRTKAQTGALTNIANYMSGFQDIYPSPGTIAGLATNMANQGGGGAYGGGGGVSYNPASQVGGPSYLASRTPTQLQSPANAPGGMPTQQSTQGTNSYFGYPDVKVSGGIVYRHDGQGGYYPTTQNESAYSGGAQTYGI